MPRIPRLPEFPPTAMVNLSHENVICSDSSVTEKLRSGETLTLKLVSFLGEIWKENVKCTVIILSQSAAFRKFLAFFAASTGGAASIKGGLYCGT